MTAAPCSRPANNVPRPADIVASNFYVEIDLDLCSGNGACVGQCPTDAITLEAELASLDLGRCIGCGLCVPPCPEDAIRLVQKAEQTVPPRSEEDLYDMIMAGKEAARSD